MTTNVDPIATPANLAAARADGYAAYQQNRPAAPGASATILDMVGNAPVGTPGFAELCAAFSAGYDQAADEAANAVLAADGFDFDAVPLGDGPDDAADVTAHWLATQGPYAP